MRVKLHAILSGAWEEREVWSQERTARGKNSSNGGEDPRHCWVWIFNAQRKCGGSGIDSGSG